MQLSSWQQVKTVLLSTVTGHLIKCLTFKHCNSRILKRRNINKKASAGFWIGCKLSTERYLYNASYMIDW